MLHRAARNAYSWWWASHVRTKQSKWLDQNLQDMEEKVEYILNIIDEDGDTFAQRAEMYYRKRPEIVNFVEDSFRGYRALAERYDHLSRELQGANRTIATVFPESLHLSMDDDDFDGEKLPKSALPLHGFSQLSQNPPPAPEMSFTKNPSVRKKNGKMPSRLMSRKGLLKFNAGQGSVFVPVSGLSKSQALQKIDKLQKEILALQTEKEFVKSSYECGLEKYWNFEKQITELQAEVSNLQDEFRIGTDIEDDLARTLMTATALKSCQETLTRLQEKQKQSAEEARAELQKIQEAREKFRSLKGIFESNQAHQEEHLLENKTRSKSTEVNYLEQEMDSAEQNHHIDAESLRKRIKEELQVSLGTSLTMSELAEKVDELVDKIINMEIAVSSQSAHVKRLRSETNELQTHIQSLEEEKESLIEGSHDMNQKIKDLEEELQRVQNLNQSINEKGHHLQTHFIEASYNLDDLSEKLHDVKPDEEAGNVTSFSQAADFSGANLVEQMTTTLEAQVVSQGVNMGKVEKHDKVEELRSSVRTSSSNHAGLLRDKEVGTISNANQGTKAESSTYLLSNQSTNQRHVNPEMSSQNENGNARSYDIETLQDMRMGREGMQDDILEPSASFTGGKSIIPSDQGDQLHNQPRKDPVSDVHADSYESKFEEMANVRAPHRNLTTDGHTKVEPNVDVLGPSHSPNHMGNYSFRGEVRGLPDAHPEKSATNRNNIVPGKTKQMEGETLGHSTIQSAAQNHSRPSERERDGDHSILSLFNSKRDVSGENNGIQANLSPAKSITNSQESGLNIHLTDLPPIQEKSNSKSSPQKESIANEGISFPDISTAWGDSEIADNQKKNSFSDQGKNQEPEQQNMYETMERKFFRDQDERGVEEDDQPNWKELFLNGLDDKEKLLLQEYASILRNYKEARKKLNDVEKKKRASLFQYCIQIKVLKSANASKDAKIQSLEKKLNLIQKNQDGTPDSRDSKTTASLHVPDDWPLIEDQKALHVVSHDHGATSNTIDASERSTAPEKPKISFIEDDGGIEVINIDKPHNLSIVEERIRTDIDELLEENIEFWMKFSTAFHQIRKFHTTVQDLKAELVIVKENNRQNGNTNSQSLISDVRPIYRHLSEKQTELTLWLDQSSLLNEDLENRFSSLSGIQEEITRLSNAGRREEEIELSEYQAGKFQGEILNMKQENNKVAAELRSGREHVKILLVEIERTLRGLDAEFGISTRRQVTSNPSTRSKIPLRTFLFGVKLKKHKPSIFACMSPSLQKQYSDLAALPI